MWMRQIFINGMDFQTTDGKQVLFNGINVVCKDAEMGYFFPDLEKSFQAFQKKGFNLIRFGIFWDGVEPQPGQYDMEYLDKVKEAILLAEKYEMYVMVDMHQDLFARKYADGAPGPLWTKAHIIRQGAICGMTHIYKAKRSSGRRIISGQIKRQRTV